MLSALARQKQQTIFDFCSSKSRDDKGELAPQTPSSGYSSDRQRSSSAEGRDRLDARSKHFFQTTEFRNLSDPVKKNNNEPAGND